MKKSCNFLGIKPLMLTSVINLKYNGNEVNYQMNNTNFTVEEVIKIGDIIKCIYDKNLPLCKFTEDFMHKLKTLIYFDKSDFMFFKYNDFTKRYEMESFRPVNWSNKEIHDYINEYMHKDDVLPILSQPEYIAFRNSDLFSLSGRRETEYFQQFASDVSLEISIDANIPLPSDCDTIAILGLFRSIEKIEFSQRDLEIVKLLQPHLSERMKTDICNSKCIGNGNCGGVGKCKEAAEISQPASGDWELNNIDTLGICACDINGNIISSNTSFFNFSVQYNDKNSQNPMIDAMKKCVLKLTSSDFLSMGPIPIHIKEDTYMVQLAYNDSSKDRITAAVYYTSDLFTKRLAALKLEYKLSNREFEIIYLSLKRSLTNAEIAQELFISEATVKRHLYTVYQKIGINNQKQLFHELQMI